MVLSTIINYEIMWCLLRHFYWLLHTLHKNTSIITCIKYKLSDMHGSALHVERFCVQCTKLLGHRPLWVKRNYVLHTVNFWSLTSTYHSTWTKYSGTKGHGCQRQFPRLSSWFANSLYKVWLVYKIVGIYQC